MESDRFLAQRITCVSGPPVFDRRTRSNRRKRITMKSKKNIASAFAPIYARTLMAIRAGRFADFQMQNMRNFKARKGKLLLFTAVWVCLCPRLVYTAGSTVEATSSSSTTTISAEQIEQTDQMGTGIFSRLPFHVSVSARGGYDDNIFTSSTAKQESWFTNAGIALTYDFGSPRTQLSLGMGAGVTYYFDRPGDDIDENVYLSLSLTHKANPRLTFAVVAYATYQSEPDFSFNLGLNRRGGNFFYTQDKFTVIYLWTPRFSTATSYTLGAVRYNDSAIGFFEDRIENTVGNEFRFLVWPTTTVVGEYRYQIVTYDQIARDSMTHFVLVGFDHAFSPRFSASLRGGVEFRDYEESGDRSSPYFEGTLKYALGKDTSMEWTNRYGIEESDVLINPSRKTFRTGLRVKHNFTARITGTLGAYYQHDKYDAIETPMVIGAAFDENSIDVAVAIRYALTRYFAVEAGYNHSEVLSDSLFREYSRNRFFGGLNLTF